MRHGETLHVFAGLAADSQQRDEWLQNLRDALTVGGDALQFPDGSSEWLGDEAIVDTSKSGSEQYTWDKAGQRVKCRRSTYYRDAAGNVEAKFCRIVWRNFENV